MTITLACGRQLDSHYKRRIHSLHFACHLSVNSNLFLCRMFKKNRVLSNRRRLLRSKWGSAGEMNAVLSLNLTEIAAKEGSAICFYFF